MGFIIYVCARVVKGRGLQCSSACVTGSPSANRREAQGGGVGLLLGMPDVSASTATASLRTGRRWRRVRSAPLPKEAGRLLLRRRQQLHAVQNDGVLALGRAGVLFQLLQNLRRARRGRRAHSAWSGRCTGADAAVRQCLRDLGRAARIGWGTRTRPGPERRFRHAPPGPGAAAFTRGRKPMNVNAGRGKPDTERAVTAAQGPLRRRPRPRLPPRPRRAGCPGRRCRCRVGDPGATLRPSSRACRSGSSRARSLNLWQEISLARTPNRSTGARTRACPPRRRGPPPPECCAPPAATCPQIADRRCDDVEFARHRSLQT